MYSILDTIVENELLVFRHLGEINNFEEQPIDEKKQGWTDALESYELVPVESGTELTVKVDTVDNFADSMNRTFPLALEELKRISES